MRDKRLDGLTRQRTHRVSVDGVFHVVGLTVWFVLALTLIKNAKQEHVLLVDADLLPRLIQTAWERK